MPRKDIEGRRAYQREYQRRWKAANRDKVRRYKVRAALRHGDEQRVAARERREHLPDDPAAVRARVRAYNERYPERYRARYLMSNAIRDGRLLRCPCEVCGDPKSQGHHEDYSKPLEVRWLCRRCHMDRHVEVNDLRRLAELG